MEEMRDVLLELNAKVLRADSGIEETFDRAWRMLRCDACSRKRGRGTPCSRTRELVSYYANGIAHLLGEFETAVRASDALPVERASGSVTAVR